MSVLNCSCNCVWLEQVSHWKRPELCRKWKLFWTELETKQETLLWVCFHVLTGIWTVVYCHRQVRYDLRCLDCYSLFVKFGTDVAVETGTDAEKVYWTLRQVGTLELLSDWLNFVWRYFGSCIFPFGLEQPYRTSLDGWMSTEISASQFYCETSSMVFIAMIASVICLRWLWHFLW